MVATRPPGNSTKPNSEQVRAWAENVAIQLELQAFDVFLTANHLHLWSLEVPTLKRKRGVGSQAMKYLTDYADRHGMTIVLSPGLRDSRHGTTSRTRLVRFYRGFGFVLNKGRTTDYAISAGMYRLPKSFCIRGKR